MARLVLIAVLLAAPGCMSYYAAENKFGEFIGTGPHYRTVVEKGKHYRWVDGAFVEVDPPPQGSVDPSADLERRVRLLEYDHGR